jgi:thioredoxin reductase (NADPH)
MLDALVPWCCHDPLSMETPVPDLFIAGVVAAGLDANKVFLENGREHGDRIVTRLAAR